MSRRWYDLPVSLCRLITQVISKSLCNAAIIYHAQPRMCDMKKRYHTNLATFYSLLLPTTDLMKKISGLYSIIFTTRRIFDPLLSRINRYSLVILYSRGNL